MKYKAVFHTLSCTGWPSVRLWKCSVGWVVRSGLKLMKVQGLHNLSTDKTLIRILMVSACKFVHVSDLFSLRSWHRKLHIWSPNYTPMLALHKLCKWLCFGYAIATIVIRSSFFMQSYFWHGRRIQKVCGPAYDTCASTLAIATLVLLKHRFWMQPKLLQVGENVRVEEVSVWNFFRRRLSVSLQRLCYCD